MVLPESPPPAPGLPCHTGAVTPQDSNPSALVNGGVTYRPCSGVGTFGAKRPIILLLTPSEVVSRYVWEIFYVKKDYGVWVRSTRDSTRVVPTLD